MDAGEGGRERRVPPSPKVFGARPPPRGTSHRATGGRAPRGDGEEGGSWQQRWLSRLQGLSPRGLCHQGHPAGTKAAAAATLLPPSGDIW